MRSLPSQGRNVQTNNRAVTYGSAISDPQHQYDATQITATNGGSISTWPDEIAGDDLTAGAAPTYDADGINGIAALNFDGTDDTLDTTFGTTISEPFEIFTVARIDTLTFNTTGIKDGATTDEASLGEDANKDFFIRQGTTQTAGNADTNNHIFDEIYRSSTDTLRIDATQKVDADSGSSNLTGLTVGERPDGFFADVHIGEIRVFDRELSLDERSAVESDFSDKWGITI